MTVELHERSVRRIAPHFQRSINLTYDAGNDAYISGYIPTARTAQATASILENMSENARQRAHVLHAPYGSGKSLFSIFLSALAANDATCQRALDLVQDRLNRHYPEHAKNMVMHRESGRKLFPILLTGDSGSFGDSLIRALTTAVRRQGLGDLQPQTRYTAALKTIDMWEKLYPDVYEKFASSLAVRSLDPLSLSDALSKHDSEALSLFEDLYTPLAAGARFDSYYGATLPDIFHHTAVSLRDVGYQGIIIVWDEFGRFMEDRVNQVFDKEAEQLQNFAEFCNRSGEYQVHIVLVAHRQLSTYATGLPLSYQREWARISKRFQEHDISGDPEVMYRLITEAFEVTDSIGWREFLSRHSGEFHQLIHETAQFRLFDVLAKVDAPLGILERVWPLHPLTLYALPLLSREVAQNERTMFTFLASDETHSLQAFAELRVDNLYFVRIDALWDYFSDAIRQDARPGGWHPVWSGANYAIGKVEPEATLAQRIVKTIGVLLIIGQTNTRSGIGEGRIVPSTDMLAYATGAPKDDVKESLRELSRKRAIVFRRADGYWMFTRGSDIDIEFEIANLVSKKAPSRLQLRRLLQNHITTPIHFPRGYNLAHAMTRYFRSIYRWPDELEGVANESFLKNLDRKQKIDGLVVYVLITKASEREEVLDQIRHLPPSRSVFVVPKKPLLIEETLNELFALEELRNNSQFMSQDERLVNEIEFFTDDATKRLEYVLNLLLRPAGRDTVWLSHNNSAWLEREVSNQREISRLLTDICHIWFPQTPVFNNESLNLHQPNKTQVRAAERVVDLLIINAKKGVYPFDLGMEGYGPDRLILRTILVQTGLLQPSEESLDEEPDTIPWRLVTPDRGAIAAVWELVQQFLDQAKEEEQEFVELIGSLQQPPYGIRRGVLPVMLAAMSQGRLNVLTIRKNRRVVLPITGSIFSELCYKPDEFTVEVGEWDERRGILWWVLEDSVRRLVGVHEQEHQPLSYLSLGLLRWLQSLPRYCRDTNTLPGDAQRLRELIRLAQHEPAQVLLHDLLKLLDDGQIDHHESKAYQDYLAKRLSANMSQVSGSYQNLLHSLDQFAEETFTGDSVKRYREGQAAMRNWLRSIEQQADDLDHIQFSDLIVQRFVDAIRSDHQPGQFWDAMGKALIGVSPSDWNDRSHTNFRESLLEAKERFQREVLEIAVEEEVTELLINQTQGRQRAYRFRSSELSEQGRHILENFKTTMAIAGRPLSPDERRQVALAFLSFVMEADQGGIERKNKSLRIRR